MKASEVIKAIKKEFGEVRIEKYRVWNYANERRQYQLLVYANVERWAFDNLRGEVGQIWQWPEYVLIVIHDKDWDVDGPDVIFEVV